MDIRPSIVASNLAGFFAFSMASACFGPKTLSEVVPLDLPVLMLVPPVVVGTIKAFTWHVARVAMVKTNKAQDIFILNGIILCCAEATVGRDALLPMPQGIHSLR